MEKQTVQVRESISAAETHQRLQQPGRRNALKQLLHGGVALASITTLPIGVAHAVTSSQGGELNVTTFGADPTGQANSTAAVNAALASLPSGGGTLYFPPGVYKLGTIRLPARPVKLRGEEGTKVTPASEGINIFERVDHIFFHLDNIEFVNCYRPVVLMMSVTQSASNDFLIERCKFTDVKLGGTGILLSGAREGTIQNCSFSGKGFFPDTGDGIYRTLTANTVVSECIFESVRHGIIDDGQASPYSCGLNLTDSTMLHVIFGYTSYSTDSILIDGCMIDYCEYPIRLFSQDGATINNSYISSSPNVLSVKIPANNSNNLAPAIYIGQNPNSSESTHNVKVNGCELIKHCFNARNGNTITANCVEVYDAQSTHFHGNTIHFFTLWGIRYKNCSYSQFSRNVFSPRSGASTPTCIANVDPISETIGRTNKAFDNTFNAKAFVDNDIIISRNNIGYKDNVTGNAKIPAGSTSVTISHGMDVVPQFLFFNANVPAVPGSIQGSSSLRFTIPTASVIDVVISWNAKHKYAE